MPNVMYTYTDTHTLHTAKPTLNERLFEYEKGPIKIKFTHFHSLGIYAYEVYENGCKYLFLCICSTAFLFALSKFK